MDEFGVRHQDGQITVNPTGHPHSVELFARQDAEKFSCGECNECGAVDWPHEVVIWERGDWRPVRHDLAP